MDKLSFPEALGKKIITSQQNSFEALDNSLIFIDICPPILYQPDSTVIPTGGPP